MAKILWFVVLLLTPSVFALDPQKPITQFIHTSWTDQQGAPDDIRALAQTTDGYLWLGTTNGLFHFDGVRFARFEARKGEQFPALRVRTLLATRDGALWIVFAPGTVSRLLEGRVTTYSERDGLPATFGLAEQSDGTLIAGTAKGLVRFRNGIWKDAGKDWDLPRKPVGITSTRPVNSGFLPTIEFSIFLPGKLILSIQASPPGRRGPSRKHRMERFGFLKLDDLLTVFGEAPMTVR